MNPEPFQGETELAQAAGEKHLELKLKLSRRGRSTGQYLSDICRIDLISREVEFRGTAVLS